MNINSLSASSYLVPLFRESLQFSLTSFQKKVGAIALIVLGALALGYVAYRSFPRVPPKRTSANSAKPTGTAAKNNTDTLTFATWNIGRHWDAHMIAYRQAYQAKYGSNHKVTKSPTLTSDKDPGRLFYLYEAGVARFAPEKNADYEKEFSAFIDRIQKLDLTKPTDVQSLADEKDIFETYCEIQFGTYKTLYEKKLAAIRKERLIQEIEELKKKTDGILFLQEVGFQAGQNDTVESKRDKIAKGRSLAKQILGNGEQWEFHYDGVDCLVAWDTSRFTLLDSQDNKAVVLLQSKATQKVIKAASVHLKGFSLATCKDADRGDRELEGIVKTLDHFNDKRVPALTLIAGDFNSTPTIHPERLDILRNNGFKTDDADHSPTAYNSDFNQAHLDYIFAKTANAQGVVVTTPKNVALPYLPLENLLENPSDHSPLLKTIA